MSLHFKDQLFYVHRKLSKKKIVTRTRMIYELMEMYVGNKLSRVFGLEKVRMIVVLHLNSFQSYKIHNRLKYEYEQENDVRM